MQKKQNKNYLSKQPFSKKTAATPFIEIPFPAPLFLFLGKKDSLLHVFEGSFEGPLPSVVIENFRGCRKSESSKRFTNPKKDSLFHF